MSAEFPIFQALPNALFLDLEVTGSGYISSAGVFGAGWQEEAHGGRVHGLLRKLDERVSSGSILCGHNILDHDLPYLRERYPALRNLQAAPVLDSLFLSPIAFPKKPYHALVKGKELASLPNSPGNDCQASARVLGDVLKSLQSMRELEPDRFRMIVALLRDGLPKQGGIGISKLDKALGFDSVPLPQSDRLHLLARLTKDIVCPNQLLKVAEVVNGASEDALALAYVMAWLPVAGSDSVLPNWVSRRVPTVDRFVRLLRRTACGSNECAFCLQTHNATAQLQRWFRFPSFRPEPSLPGCPGRSLQEALVQAGMNGDSILGMLPTGGGKSLCFQLPALYRYHTTGALTIVISPLQALMKDQVDNLITRAGICSCAALYGLLTIAERKVLLDEVAMGSIGLLYVSPEQLRSTSFRRAISARKIDCWVYDEAHCLSKWGHDFRPDYFYAARFIRELATEQGAELPSICCVTATAKKDVQQEICEHIHEELGHNLRVFDGGAERTNLDYRVEEASSGSKEDRIHEILTDRIGFPNGQGSAVVFCATQKSTERIATDLQRRGWHADFFHAGRENEEKKRVFENFVAGKLRVIVATNAFGMGVDKADIRVVIHAETPGSLENYLQEAGRAGRDGEPAECILLYHDKDLEKQFGLSGFSSLRFDEVREIWKAIYKADKKAEGVVVLTAQEILGKAHEIKNPDFFNANKMNAAIALLEKQGFLKRDENRPIVFQGRALVRDLDEGERKIEALKLPTETAALWKAYLSIFLSLEGGGSFGLDPFVECEITDHAMRRYEAGTRTRISPYRFVINTLNEMAAPQAGLIRKGILFSAWIRNGKQANIHKDLQRLCAAENCFLNLLREAAPDAEGYLPCQITLVNRKLADAGFPCKPEHLIRLIKQWEGDLRQLFSRPEAVEIHQNTQDIYYIKVHRSWEEVAEGIRARHEYLREITNLLTEKAGEISAEVLVDFSEHELVESFWRNMVLASMPLSNPGNAILHLLAFAHQTSILKLQNGKGLITSAMTLRLSPEKTQGKRVARFTKGDFASMEVFYTERILQIHVIGEYARAAGKKISGHLRLIADYFRLDKLEFARRYLGQNPEQYQIATSIESYNRIVDALGNPDQQAIVAAADSGNRIILAGPGSGKTRVIVHRCACLLRVKRLRPREILVLCFNRNACLELRRRIYSLVDDDARGMVISTYHGLALRLLGRSRADLAQQEANQPIDFKGLLREATAWLRGETEVIGADPENLRDSLLGDIRHILIDEYQDVDEDEYAFIRALSGIDTDSDSKRPTMLAVGDDDQSIYQFKGANVEFIRRFTKEYQAAQHHLLENYRSTAHIIAVANHLIALNHDRMKDGQPIRINRQRKGQPGGGRWEPLDPVTRGRVQRLEADDELHQAWAVVQEIERIHELSPETPWRNYAILARQSRMLMPLRSLLEERGLPFHFDPQAEHLPSIFRIREIHNWLELLRTHVDEAWDVDQIHDNLSSFEAAGQTTWSKLLRLIAHEWEAWSGKIARPLHEIRSFFYDSLSERRRERTFGDGIQLLTVHRAKGMEFDHVLVLDGGWADGRRPSRHPDTEEDRRIYYVAMTRAKETLTILQRKDIDSRFPAESGPAVLSRPAPQMPPQEQPWFGKRYLPLTPDHLFLSYAGNRPELDPIHRRLNELSEGSILQLRSDRDRLVLSHPSGTAIAQLSQKGKAHWAPLLDQVQFVQVVAMLQRLKIDGDPAYQSSLTVDQWEVPFCEVLVTASEGRIADLQPEDVLGANS